MKKLAHAKALRIKNRKIGEAMKSLNQFRKFNFNEFANGKTFAFVNASDWKDYNTQQLLGTKVKLVITADNTKYEKEGVTNAYEKFTVKVPGVEPSAFLKFESMKTAVKVNCESAVVWGNYQNNLSITGSIEPA